MPRTRKLTRCGDCQARFGPHVQPGRIPGLCDVCAPLHEVHLALSGDFSTYCGKSMQDVNADDAQSAVFDQVTHEVNCMRCLDVHNTRTY